MIGLPVPRRASDARLPQPRVRDWLRVTPALLPLLLGGVLVGERVWLAAKARVAVVLIERAFTAHLEDGAPHPPWDWADTWPLARLEVPRLGIERIVLAGATGATLAFGPGHVDGTARPGSSGNVVLAGHRDTTFAFLRNLSAGDVVRLRTRGGVELFRVERLEVRDMHDADVLAPTAEPTLTLITCYPFDRLVGGPQRYVVTCVRLDENLEHRGWVS